MYIIQIEYDGCKCWIAPWKNGDPPRTTVKENAQRFKTEKTAEKRIAEVKRSHPLRKIEYKVISMETISAAYIRSIRAALADKGLMEQKESLVYQYTNERTTHISEMSQGEALELLAKLNEGDKPEDQRAKMIRLCYSLGYQMQLVGEDGKIDKPRFDALIQRLSPQHKDIGSHSYEELKMLCTVFRKYYNEWLKSPKHEETKT